MFISSSSFGWFFSCAGSSWADFASSGFSFFTSVSSLIDSVGPLFSRGGASDSALAPLLFFPLVRNLGSLEASVSLHCF